MTLGKITNLRLIQGVAPTPSEDEPLTGIRSCDQCIHYLSGLSGEYCRAYNEDLFNVHQADDCPDYEVP